MAHFGFIHTNSRDLFSGVIRRTLADELHLGHILFGNQSMALQSLRQLLQSNAWTDSLAQLSGYTPELSGQVRALRKVLPWWDFARAKRKPAPKGATISKFAQPKPASA